MENPIKGLIGSHVHVEDIGKLLGGQGVVVKVSGGGGTNAYQVTPKVYGIIENNLTPDSTEFMNEHVKGGRFALIPKKDEARAKAILSKTRKKLKEIAIGYGDSYVPISSYPEFRDYFDKNQREFYELRDELSEKYATMKERFIEIARHALKELGAVEGEAELERIISKLPSKEKFTSSFRLDISVSAFPTEENMDMFDENVKSAILSSRGNPEDMVTESIAHALNEGIAAMSSVLKSGADGSKIHQRTIFGVKNAANRVAQKNIFGNPKVDEFRHELLEVVGQDTDTAMETAERVLAAMYAYAVELRLESDIDLENCPFTPSELTSIHEMYA